MSPRRRAFAWLTAAVVLLGLGAWLMSSGARGARAKPRHSAEDFPRYKSPEEYQRDEKRQTLRLPEEKPGTQELFGDPLLYAMDPNAEMAIVFEASTIRDAPVGRMMLECMLRGRELSQVEKIRDKYGMDVLKDVERFATANDVMFVTGDFSHLDLGRALADQRPEKREFAGVTIYETDSGEAFALRDDMLLVSHDAHQLEMALDRLAHPDIKKPRVLDESQTYGEIYGVFRGSKVEKLLPGDLSTKAAGVADRVELHVDATDENDVLIVADATGPDAVRVDELGRSLGSALALGRIAARREGNDDLLELLDLARVSPRGNEFQVEVVLPLELMRKHLCRENQAVP